MADAADDAGEGEVAECLRFLWKHRQVPDQLRGRFYWNALKIKSQEYWARMTGPYNKTHSGCDALDRILSAWPLHKHLLIDALEKETVT